MDDLNFYEKFIVYLGAIGMPLYAFLAIQKRKVTIRTPSGRRETYHRDDEQPGQARSFYISITLFMIGAACCWALLLGLF